MTGNVMLEVSKCIRPKHIIYIKLIFPLSVGSDMLFYRVDMKMCSAVFILTPVLQASCFLKIVGLICNCLVTEDFKYKPL